MKSFKQFFKESAESEATLPSPPDGFELPTPKSKFQIGDIVLVHWGSYNTPVTKSMRAYTNSIGKVIGYRPGGGYTSADFAVEFEDKHINKVKSHLLVGPFRSFDAARKYQGREELTSADIAGEDHKRFAEVKSEIPSIPEIEDTFKQIFVDKGLMFTWLKEPQIFNIGKLSLAILAYRDIPFKDIEDIYTKVSISDLLAKKIVFFKVFDPSLKNLVKTSSLNNNNKSSIYSMSVPTLDMIQYSIECKNGKVLKAPVSLSILSVSSPRDLMKYEQQYQKAFTLEKTKDGLNCFDLLNNVRVEGNTKVVPDRKSGPSVIFKDMVIDPSALDNYVFEDDLTVNANSDGSFMFPKVVNGSMSLMANKDVVINGFKKFPKLGKSLLTNSSITIQSFEGIQQTIEQNISCAGTIKTFKGFPKVVKGHCFVSDGVESFEGGADCKISGILSIRGFAPNNINEIPQAKDYHINDLDEDKVKEFVRKRNIQRNIINKSGIEKDYDLSALEDF